MSTSVDCHRIVSGWSGSGTAVSMEASSLFDEAPPSLGQGSDGKCDNTPTSRRQSSDRWRTLAPNREPPEGGAAVSELRVRNDELRTMREAMRQLSQMVEELERGDVEKLVLTQRNRMRAVVLSAERYSELERRLDGRPAPA